MLLETAISDFAKRIGMPSLSLDEKGVAAMDIADTGRLSLESTDARGYRELLLYVSRPIPPHAPDMERKALDYSHYRHAHPFPIQAGVHKDMLLVSTRIAEDQATGQILENASIFLMRSCEKILSN
ncbi:MAG: type III secretion chaperone SycN [Desulfovibrio sp.]|nr:type III secretion chaperone SycN [Desulfovibrio sp.]